MTTTLRPTGPLQQEAAGVRSRRYEVCDNSRPVGTIEIATFPSLGPAAGTVRSLRIDEADRRRGRGTVAVLAAEEVLRGWGCDQVRVSVPPEAAGAAALAGVLGYTERSRNMVKTLPALPPPLPDGTRARPMNDAEFALWWEEGLRSYARSWSEQGLTPAEALAKAEADRAAGLPAGRATAGVRLEVLEHHGVPVGLLYLGLREALPGETGAYVYDVEVPEEHRGRGHGRSLLLLAERLALETGARLLGLHVFADNAPALGLYTSLGHRTTAIHFSKRLL
ncbi:N-acetyltransferase [Streptomyces inusitatus]|uniref:N-acetyltransferase n=1 Tax=Streptomyces inusitatus TaxID=68221 RepID=A0A918V356_9ACTN|nr:GNAT family N-acetyltransferase [Streptomyces inusitatus]GGZ62476.1 N-acetyltransferase [Streptomyces inusitatus]